MLKNVFVQYRASRTLDYIGLDIFCVHCTVKGIRSFCQHAASISFRLSQTILIVFNVPNLEQVLNYYKVRGTNARLGLDI